jgi:hypothetical protein
LQVAIEQALMILSWRENLSRDELPPEYLWEDSKGLELWWGRVEEKRRDGFSTGSASGSDDPESPDLMENDLARAFRDG